MRKEVDDAVAQAKVIYNLMALSTFVFVIHISKHFIQISSL